MKSARVLPIVTARMGSTRLPGKSLMPLGEQSVLALLIRRLQRSRAGDNLVIATSELSRDDPIAAEAAAHGARCFRGSESDVLARVAGASRAYEGDVVVRLTADCPLNDANIVDRCIDAFCSGGFDYVTTKYKFPMGLDAEVLSDELLQRLDQTVANCEEREHVTLHIWRHETAYRTHTISPGPALSRAEIVLTLDDEADYRRLSALVTRLGLRAVAASAQEIVMLIDRHPELLKTRKVPEGLK